MLTSARSNINAELCNVAETQGILPPPLAEPYACIMLPIRNLTCKDYEQNKEILFITISVVKPFWEAKNEIYSIST